ncbi:uncharacterized protein DUF3618 [Aliiruegeria haliotis]|uniref:Uncharacterized protein DUF3618 n=1 Tax=Aliiruegeria haliotis TaxID=1280846 RepID=A0A2T0RLR6_9RHOB|nr:DUF3618 domain-containing protein [Aliiruegeria haliotis]PRY22136.1 uncharacterized protein DUF3618 [Aliiruegeria haliotis]
MSDINDIQSDIAAERMALDAKLSALGNRLSVDNLADEAKDHARGLTDDLVRPILDRVLENVQQRPVATAMVGAGLSWLMSKPAQPQAVATSEHRSVGTYNGPKPAEGDPGLETTVYGAPVHGPSDPPSDATAVEKAQDVAEQVAEQGRRKLMELRGQARELRRHIADGTEEMSDAARTRVIEAREKAIDAIDSTRTQARRSARSSADFVRENPALVGGLALTAGAALAGILLTRRSSDEDTDRDDDRRFDAFDEADRIYDEEVARMHVGTDHSITGELNDSEKRQDAGTSSPSRSATSDGSVLSKLND